MAGGDPTASDELVVSGTTGNDAISYTLSDTVGAGSVAITGSATVNFTTTESLVLEAKVAQTASRFTSPTGRRTTVTPAPTPTRARLCPKVLELVQVQCH